MPFPSALSAGNYTSLRTTYSARQYVALCPNTPVFQIRPASASATSTYAEIAYSTVELGTFTNVKVGQVVLITSSTDLRRPLFRGRVRKAATANILYINETGFALNTSHYVTVLDTYDVAPRLQRITSAGALLIDWDVTYRTLAPLISGLQSSYVVPTSSTSASLSFTPIATAMASGATISSWLWDVGDGTVTVGTTSTQNVTVSFPAGHRWVRLTVTNSAGASNYFVFEVYVVNPYSSALVYEVTESTVNAQAETGYSATITARSGVANVLEQTRATLFSVERYGTTEAPILNNIDCIGYIRQESVSTTMNPDTLQVQSVTFDIEGFLNKLSTTPIAAIRMDNATTATVWGQIVNATPARAIAYLLQYHTTASNLIGMTFDSDAQDYIFPQLLIEANNALDAINTLADGYNARMNIAPDGIASVRRQAVYLDDTGRNALTTVALIETQDVFNYAIQRDQIQTVAQCIVGAGRYTTATRDVAIFTGRAPGVALGEGYEETQLNGQILKANINDATARVEVARRTANHLAASNPADELTVDMRDGWRFIVPNVFQWYTFSLPASNNNRNIAYFSNNRFTLQSVTINATATGRRAVSATFRRETQDTQAQIVVARVPLTTETPLPVLPVLGEYPFLGTDGNINYPTDDPADFDLQPFNPGDMANLEPLPVEAAVELGDQASPCPNGQTITLNFASGAFLQSNPTNLLYDYDLTISGDALISPAALTWTQAFDFTLSTGGWAMTPAVSGNPQGLWTAGQGWRSQNARSATSYFNNININFTALANSAFTAITMTFNIVSFGTYTLATSTNVLFAEIPVAVNQITRTRQQFIDDGVGNQTAGPFTVTNTIASGQSFRLLYINGFRPGLTTPPGGEAYLTGATFTGTGINPFTGINPATPVRGDAFYYGYDSGPAVAYSVGQGLLINSAQPVNYPAYNASHEYSLTLAGTGNPFTYQFVDPDGDYTNNNPNPLIVRQCRGQFQGT